MIPRFVSQATAVNFWNQKQSWYQTSIRTVGIIESFLAVLSSDLDIRVIHYAINLLLKEWSTVSLLCFFF